VTRYQRGRAIYNFRCYFCHGYSGDAKTLAATYLDPKPRNFRETSLNALSRETMINAVLKGKPGTAMKSFAKTLSMQDIETVVDFVRKEFMRDKKINTRYHTAENGWPNHRARYGKAFPFALGEIAIDVPADQLTKEQREGKKLFMNSCISCHDRGKATSDQMIWEPQAVSYPRNQYHPAGDKSVDSTSGATPFAKHDVKPKLSGLTPQEKAGERLFQKNCAFCHAADGTGKNWIGSFLQPHPRNLTDPKAMASMTKDRLQHVIRNGLPGTTMSAWKNILNDEQISSIISYINRALFPLKDK
jgi:cytochrome c oxidase cbb3-type subunit 3